MSDALTTLLKAINTFEKAEGGNHRLRHISGALREARYAATRVQADTNYESPGTASARETATKAHVPAPADERDPNVPAESGTNDAATGDS